MDASNLALADIESAKCGSETYFVFVYGTLKRHESNHHVMADSRRIASQVRTSGVMYDTGFAYPAIISSDTSRVYGELYEVHTNVLPALDELEGYHGPGKDNLYQRVVQTVYTDTCDYRAITYVQSVQQVHNKPRVPFHDWGCRDLLAKEDATYHFFAYGSAMDTKRMEGAGVASLFTTVVGRGICHGYSLECRVKVVDGGRADLVENGGCVEGKIYRIGKQATRYLLDREGAWSGVYRPVMLDVESPSGMIRALAFLVVDKAEDEIMPPAWYWNECLRGAEGVVSEPYLRMLQGKYPMLQV